jgi:hypothetical protein
MLPDIYTTINFLHSQIFFYERFCTVVGATILLASIAQLFFSKYRYQ